MTPASPTPPIELVHAILGDDVRLEMGDKLTFVGVFSATHLLATILKCAVVPYWRGGREYLSEVRILFPDRRHALVASHLTSFSIPSGSYADQVTFPVMGGVHRPDARECRVRSRASSAYGPPL